MRMMGSFKNYRVLVSIILVMIPMTTTVIAHDHDYNFTAGLQPFYEKLCEEVNCGKGTCKADIGYPFGYICECDSGWKRTREDDDDLTFLPCVIPNCNLNYNCQPAPPPVPEKPVPLNASFFDPCYWVYCGEGSCTKNRTYTHTCECRSGFSNLLDISAFPCYSECTLGSDCANLGIKVANSISDNGTGQGNSILPGKFHWVAISVMSMAMLLWN